MGKVLPMPCAICPVGKFPPKPMPYSVIKSPGLARWLVRPVTAPGGSTQVSELVVENSAPAYWFPPIRSCDGA